jgi:hypothetical protein
MKSTSYLYIGIFAHILDLWVISLKTEKTPGKTLEFHIWKRVGTLY